MRIDELTLKNFRGFTEQTFHFHPEFNILIGENGAGKTAVLDAVAVAISCWFLGIRGFNPIEIEQNDVHIQPSKDSDESGFEQYYPVEVKAKGIVFREIEGIIKDGRATSRSAEMDIAWGRTLKGVGSNTEESSRSFESFTRDVDEAVRAGDPVILPMIAYYGAGRLWQQPEDKESQRITEQRELSRFEGYRNAIDNQVSARELTRWLGYQDYAAYQDRKPSTTYRLVLEAMRKMIPDVADVSFHARRLEVVITFSDGRKTPFDFLSEGQRNMLALAGDIAMRMARLNPHLGENALRETPGIVLIDELDLHLHPRWQRHVVADLRRLFPKIQFFATTHSPQIISEIEPESITTLCRQGDQLVVEKPSQSYGLDANWILQTLMHVPSRPIESTQAIDRVDDAIEEGDLKTAREELEKLRQLINGESLDTVRLDVSISSLEALAEDEELDREAYTEIHSTK